jgi:phosphoribosylpyrophosphate synthetase
MSELSYNGDKKLVLASGRAHPELAEEVARCLETELLPMSAYDFANGEIYVRSGESVRGKEVFIIQAHPAPLNNWLMEQLIMVDSMKRASARRITVVAPFYPYARQDKKGRGREPISARLVADLYKTAGAVRVLKDAGAKDVIIAATHAVFSEPASERLANCGAREVVVTNTLPIPAKKRFETLTVLSIAPLLARAIKEVFEDGSVTSLFDGNA